VKAPPFEYHAAGSVEEAVGLLAEHGDEAKVLAGGQSLVPLLTLRLARPAHLIDINGVEDLAGVRDDGTLEIGAMVRHRTLERSEVVRSANPLLTGASRLIGHTAIRNRGTVGGSIAHADPAAELPAVFVALEGEAVVRSGRGTRSIAAGELFEGFLTTALNADELLVAVRLPAWPAGAGWSFQELSRRCGDFAVVGVTAVVVLGADGRVATARVVFTGVAGTPVRATNAETLLTGQVPSDALWREAAENAGAELHPPSDLHGTGAYRRHLATVLARRALQEAHGRAEVAA